MERLSPEIPVAPSGDVRSRASLAIFAAAVCAYALVALWVTRGTSFTYDELTWITDVDGFHLGSLLAPHNGHLILATRTIYAACAELFGLDHLAVRIPMIVAVAAAASVAFTMLRRRIGDLAALPLAVLILFFGTSTVPVDPNVAVFAQSTAAGLGALLMLERPSPRRDLAACFLLVVAVSCFTLGIAFLVGALVLLMRQPGLFRRCWVVAVPAVAYAAWWIWARQFGQEGLDPGALLQLPSAAATTLAAAAGALSGVGHQPGQTAADLVDPGPGALILVIAVAAIAYRAIGSRTKLSPVASALAVTLAFFLISINISDVQFRPPESSRYLYPAGILLVLIAADLESGRRHRRGALIAILGFALFALAGNLSDLRSRGEEIRLDSVRIRAQLAMLDLEADRVGSNYFGILLPVHGNSYLATVARYGSFADTPAELAQLDPTTGAQADAILGQILRPSLVPAPRVAGGQCTSIPVSGGIASFPLPSGGLRLSSRVSADVHLARFGIEPTVEAGVLQPGAPALLSITPDSNPTPWMVTVTTAGSSISACSPDT